MAFAIGFGSTEERVERAEEENFLKVVRTAYAESGACYISKDVIAVVEKAMDERSKAINAAAKDYGTATQFPDRYSSFHVSVAHNPSNVVGIFRFHHINRRHALSPDGWASLMTTRLVHVDSSDLRRANSNAA